MPRRKFEILSGHEIRGFKIRLYPDKQTEDLLAILEADSRRAWNWLVSQTEVVLEAREALALREGLVGSRPSRPDYTGLSPDAAKSTKEAYIAQCRARHQAVHEATSKRPECTYRPLKEWQDHFGDKFDYQLMTRVINWKYEGTEEPREIKPCAHLLQALVKNYFTHGVGQRRKKFRRFSDSMPLQVRSGHCFKLGDFGSRGHTHGVSKTFYNCQVSINGLKIRGRLPGKAPEGRVLEGVSLIKEADGWWASIKQEVPIRMPPAATPGSVIGIDVGLDNLVAFSDGTRVANPRGKTYAERIAGRQAEKKPVGRLHLAAARHIRHLIYNEVVKPLARVETIKVEKLGGRIGQMGSAKTSAMRLVVRLLQERYGSRVREVPSFHTSQDCSQCGLRSKESWSYEHGRYGKCPGCGYRADRDVNAARNIAAKASISLET